jgi:nucleotide-binding universal stress UspA family protein
VLYTIVVLVTAGVLSQEEIEQTRTPLTVVAEQIFGPVGAVIDVAHDVFGSLIDEANNRQADLLLMGWQGDFNVSHIYNSPVQRIIVNAPADVAVLKNRGLATLDSILVPWGGGPHAQLGLEFALRIGEATGATINLLRIVQPLADLEAEREAFRASAEAIMLGYERVQYHVQPGENITGAMTAFMDAEQHDLIIIGASHEWRIPMSYSAPFPTSWPTTPIVRC